MPCAETERRLHAYFDGELDALAAAAFESHLETCAECRAALEDLKAMRSALRAELPYERAPAALTARITAALDQRSLDAGKTQVAGTSGLHAIFLARLARRRGGRIARGGAGLFPHRAARHFSSRGTPRRSRQCARPLAPARAPRRCRVDGSAHREALVRGTRRCLAGGIRLHGAGLSPARRTRRLLRAPARRGARLSARLRT